MVFFVRYCGGCNPEYDRVALVSALARLTGWTVRYDEPESGCLCLLISGCRRACVEPPSAACRLIRVADSRSAAQLVDLMIKEAEK